MNDIDKLRVMLPHWINHNREHGAEFTSWSAKVLATDHEGAEEIAGLLHQAVDACYEVTAALERAMARAGGPLDHEEHTHAGHTHGHHHHHEHD